MELQQYARAVHEESECISAMQTYSCSRRGEIAYLVLDWLTQGYPERRIVATLKYFRDTVEDRVVYAETITQFLREYTTAKRK